MNTGLYLSVRSVLQRRARLLYTDCQKLSEYDKRSKAHNGGVQDIFRNANLGNDSRIPDNTDVVIIGGGAIGMATACWLKQLSSENLSVTVIERDFTYCRAATTLSVGSIRQQFSLPENILMSLFSFDFLSKVKMHLSVLGYDLPDICLNQQGYLFLASENGLTTIEKNYETQRFLGAKVELLTARKLKDKFPWLNTNGISAGCHGVDNEGWFDPWLLLSAFKMKAVSLGVNLLSGTAVGFQTSDSGEPDRLVFSSLAADMLRQVRTLHFRRCIDCGGPWSRDIARLAGIGTGSGQLAVDVPVEPRKRYVYMFHCPSGPGVSMPMLVDPSGVYVRREGTSGHYICGVSPPPGTPEPDTSNLDVDYEFFNNHIWPKIAHRVPAFEAIKLKCAWAGYYDYNYFDQNLIIGPHPQLSNFYMATGCSGHGIQHSPAIGRAMAELLTNGKFTSIDLSRLSFNRVIAGDPLFERSII